MVGSIVLTVVIVFRIADQPAEYISWGVFAALLISGANTILQAVRFWRFGAGHVLVMGTSGTFIAVCIAALVEAGPALMASLIVVSSLVQFLLAAWLPALRRIFTPVVTGTVIMLIAATVMPIVFDMLTEVPQGSPGHGRPRRSGRNAVDHPRAGVPRTQAAATLVASHRNRRWLRGSRSPGPV